MKIDAYLGLLAFVLLGLVSCGDDDAPPALGAAGDVECVRASLLDVRLAVDEDCTIAGHPMAQQKLPDLRFTSGAGLCFVVGPTDLEFTDSTGATVTARAIAYSGIVSNPIAGESLSPLPQPCDAERPTIVFTASTVAEIRREDGGEVVGELVMRDTGWAELDPATAFPSFVSERLVVTAGRGGVFADVVGELLLTGDEFGGAPAVGSLCAPRAFERLREQLGGEN